MSKSSFDIRKLTRLQSTCRREDTQLVSGAGTYTDDLSFDNCGYGIVVRSSVSSADIINIEYAQALEHEQAIGIITAADLLADGVTGIPYASTVKAPDGQAPACEKLPVLAHREVRYVGQAIAFVVAESRNAAAEMAELINIEFAPKDSVIGVQDAIRHDASLVDANVTNNIAAVYEIGDESSCLHTIRQSAYSFGLTVTNNRVIANPLEPRSSVGCFDFETDRWTLYCGNQGAHHSRRMLAAAMGCDEEKLRIIVQRIGGAFGSKLTPYPEDALVLYAAKKFSRPVSWRCDRSEAFLADFHARDHVAELEIGFDATFRITALVIRDLANLGAYPSPFGIPIATTTGNRIVNGVYDIPALALSVKTILTNTVPTAPYRGAGRPETIHRLEMALDTAAKKLNIDPAEIRRRNLIPPHRIPYSAHSGLIYDTGDFPQLLDQALTLSNWKGFSKRKVQSAKNGLLRGRGLACHIDSTSGLEPTEVVTVHLDSTGQCTFYSGTQEMGQGLNHTYSEMAAAVLEMPIEKISVVQGDTDLVVSGVGSYGSRSLMIGGMALVKAADALVERICTLGTAVLETEPAQISYANGVVSMLDESRSVTIAELAAAQTGGEITAKADAEAPFNFPNGCYVSEVEIDPETGVIQLVSLVGVDDLGNVLNETLVHGQTHGGLAQGVGQALFERIVYDEHGQLLTGSTLDYPLPRAADLPSFKIHLDQSQAATTNFLGAKGAGECGAVGGPPAVTSAVINALPTHALSSLQMPLSAEKIWRALHDR